MYVRINDDLRQKLALKWLTAKNKTKLAKEYSLSYTTIINVLSGQTKEVRGSTYDCIESLANGAPSHKEQKRRQEQKKLKEQKDHLAALKEKMGKQTSEPAEQQSSEPAKQPEPMAQNVDTQIFNKFSSEELNQVAQEKAIRQSNSDEVASLRQQLNLLQNTVSQLVTAYQLNKDLTSQLMEQVNHATKWMNEDTQHSIDNFMKHNETLTNEIKNLNTNFEVLMKRHNTLTHDNKDIKEDLKTIDIKLWPSNINKLKTTRVDK